MTGVLIVSGLSILFIGNCSSDTSAQEGDSDFVFDCKASSSKVNTPFSIDKVQLDGLSPSQFSRDKQTELALVVDNLCIRELDSPLHILGQQVVVPEELRELEHAAISLTVTGEIDLKQLSEDMEQSLCLIGITENSPVARREQPQTRQASADLRVELKNLNDPKADDQGHFEYLNYEKSLDIQDYITESVIVAVLDSGINYNHPDLSGRMWRNILGKHGEDFTHTSKKSPMDDDGHGTHVAGIIAAQQDNGYGVAGLTTGFVQLMSVKVLGGSRSRSRESGIFNGISYAINRKADIINLSVGEDEINVLTLQAVANAVSKGVFVSIAAGNDGNRLSLTSARFPASVGISVGGAMTVGSVDISTSRMSSFSNYSSEFVEIAAPGAESNSSGDGILSTGLTDCCSRMKGTSMSTAMVSAAAAVLIGYLKTNEIKYSPAGIEKILLSQGSREVSKLTSKVRGGRVLDFGRLAGGIDRLYEECE